MSGYGLDLCLPLPGFLHNRSMTNARMIHLLSGAWHAFSLYVLVRTNISLS